MTVNHGVLGSSPCSGADARGLRKVLSKRLQGAAEERGGSGKAGFLKWNTGELADLRCDPLNGKRSLKIGRFLCSPKPFLRELSSAGSERLPYKQRVGGSNPSAPTKSRRRLSFYSNVFFVSVTLPFGVPRSPGHLALPARSLAAPSLRTCGRGRRQRRSRPYGGHGSQRSVVGYSAFGSVSRCGAMSRASSVSLGT